MQRIAEVDPTRPAAGQASHNHDVPAWCEPRIDSAKSFVDAPSKAIADNGLARVTADRDSDPAGAQSVSRRVQTEEWMPLT